MQLKWHKIFSIIGGGSLLMLTFFRENMLLAINALISHQQINRAYSYWFANFFKALPYTDLVKWKWGITAFFTLLMSAITIFSLHCWFKNQSMVRFLILLYGIVFMLLALLGGGAFLMGEFDAIYFVLRLIIGAFQSPLPFFVFFVLIYFKEHTNQI